MTFGWTGATGAAAAVAAGNTPMATAGCTVDVGEDDGFSSSLLLVIVFSGEMFSLISAFN